MVEEHQRTINQLRQKPQIDPSMVEILKQQIQVCTEDFNNERKDHEQAVNKGKQLQAEVDELKVEVCDSLSSCLELCSKFTLKLGFFCFIFFIC